MKDYSSGDAQATPPPKSGVAQATPPPKSGDSQTTPPPKSDDTKVIVEGMEKLEFKGYNESDNQIATCINAGFNKHGKLHSNKSTVKYYMYIIYIYIYMYIIYNTHYTLLGKMGREINLTSNFFEMKQNNNFSLYQYHVDFHPMIDNINLRKRLLRYHSEMIGPVKAFDGMVLFCCRKLENNVSVLTFLFLIEIYNLQYRAR